MKIGWIGLGKLGTSCAGVLATAGHDVVGYDVDPKQTQTGRLENAVLDRDVVFVAVQTPHASEYEGVVPMPTERRDFEYGYLAQAVRDVANIARSRSVPLTLAVVSTVLPGTFDRVLKPLLHDGVRYAYNPAFIRLEHVAEDFRNPQVTLIGTGDYQAAQDLWQIYSLIHSSPIVEMSVASAELAKVAYNTLLTQRIVMANALAEVCDGVGADVDKVTEALEHLPDLNMTAGLGDGGPCRPRDVIAMSWLAGRLDLSYDPWGSLVRAREAQTQRVAQWAQEWKQLTGLPVKVLGESYKPETKFRFGSAARLLEYYLKELEVYYTSLDPVVAPDYWPPRNEVAIFVLAVPHKQCVEYEFPQGSVVIDPWRVVPDQPGVTVIRLGGQ